MKKLLFALLLFSASAAAQQPGPQPSAEAQALGGKLMEEINSNVSLRTQLIQAQAQIKALSEDLAKARNATKAEAKPPEPPKK